ncbi:MAG: hypothetical protein COC06_05285 [Bacteroidales bacterium]|nr:MAG: hypothetical protein COC06_05285 [Bacteroidales bacterium]
MKKYSIIVAITLLVVFTGCSRKQESEMPQEPVTAEMVNGIVRIEMPGSGSDLFGDIKPAIKDTVLKKLEADISRSPYNMDKFNRNRAKKLASVPVSEITFIPVLSASHKKLNQVRSGLAPNSEAFEAEEEYVFFYESENGKLIKAYDGEYSGCSRNYTGSYAEIEKFVREAWGDKYVDKMGGDVFVDKLIERERNRIGKERWRIHIYVTNGFMFKELEFALAHADNGKVFILRDGNMPRISYFKNNKMVYCDTSQSDDMEEVDMDGFFNLMFYIFKEQQDRLLNNRKK